MAIAAAFETLRLASALTVEMRQSGIAALPCELAQAFAFGAEHEGKRAGEGRVLERAFGFFRETDAQDAAVAELGQRLGEVLDEHDGHEVERAARGLGEHARKRRAVALGQHEAGGAEGGRRAERRADIMRIGHLIEHEQDAVGIDVVQADRRQGPHLQRHALMHRVGPEQPVEIFRE